MRPVRCNSRIPRNVHFVDGHNREIAGCWQNGKLTWRELLTWLQVVVALPASEYGPFPCLDSGDPTQPATRHGPRIIALGNIQLVPPGFYVLLSKQGSVIQIPLHGPPAIPRARYESTWTSHAANFTARVLERDGRCIITRIGETKPDTSGALHATRIFPESQVDAWCSGQWQRVIYDDQPHGQTGLDSIQNGITLTADLRALFNDYQLAINPDNDTTYCFVHMPSLDHLSIFRNPDVPDRYQPSYDLLKNHYHTCILLSMTAM